MSEFEPSDDPTSRRPFAGPVLGSDPAQNSDKACETTANQARLSGDKPHDQVQPEAAEHQVIFLSADQLRRTQTQPAQPQPAQPQSPQTRPATRLQFEAIDAPQSEAIDRETIQPNSPGSSANRPPSPRVATLPRTSPLPSRSEPNNPARNNSPARSGHSAATQALLTMAMLAATLAAARFIVPGIIEESRYAWRRGQLRAEYESSGEGLQTIGLDSLSDAYQMVTQRVGPSVVHIEVTRPMRHAMGGIRDVRHQGEPSFISDQGSGVIVDAQDGVGYLLTNHHVIADGSSIRVGLSDGRRVPAEIVGSDPLTDVALLRIEADQLVPVTWGDSDEAEVGMPVWAVGSPFGLDRTVTFGILSGKHRAAKAGTSYQDFMQSDVAVNPGNSGGPLVDARGRLIGINTAIVGDTYRGVSFSVPSNVAHRVYERLRSSGRFERGWLGVELAEVPDELAPGGNLTTRGALVSQLADPTSPAALAGINSGDIIVRFDGRDVADMGSLMRMVGNWPAGRAAQIELLREGQLQTISVDIGARPDRFNILAGGER